MTMRRAGLTAGAALAAIALPAQAGQNSERATAAAPGAASCLPPIAPKPEEALGPPVLVEGLGYSGIVPDTVSTEARRWFDHGVRLIWAYDEVEAVRAFEQAQKIDPNCAMCFWGEAWARGPTLNLQPRDEEHGKASAATARAAALAGKLGPRDRGLIAAMQVRVSGKGKFNNKGYRKAMAALAGRYPSDEVLVLAADARIMMSRDIKEGSDAQTWLETVLARNPDHSGAIHLYIHLTDFIDRQDLAVRYAERLGRLAPAASHLVHMPSHTFFGVGRYADAAAVNVAALEADRAFVAKAKPAKSDYRVGLYAHNSHFAIESAMMRGDGATALKMAEHYRERFPATGDGGGFRPVIRAATWYAAGVHAPVAEVMKMPVPEGALMKAMRLYARGEAQARAGNAAGVRAEAASLAAFQVSPEGRGLGAKPLEALVAMTEQLLRGRAAMIDGNPAAAAASYRRAMVLQEGADFGSDPPPFWYPARRSLAAALLAGGDAAGARRQLHASLEAWPHDPLALLLLARAEEKLGSPEAAAAYLERARQGWVGDPTSVPLTRI